MYSINAAFMVVMATNYLHQKGDEMAFIFELKVVPSSGRNKWMLDKSGMLKCFLKNPPEKGLANKELIKLVAKALSIPQAGVAIVSGAASRKKRLKIEKDITFNQLIAILGIERQHTILD